MPTSILRRLALSSSIIAVAALAGCAAPGEPQVGKCTNQDPDLMVQVVDIEVVDCDSDDATQRIVSEAKTRTECEQGRLTYEDRIFCTEPK